MATLPGKGGTAVDEKDPVALPGVVALEKDLAKHEAATKAVHGVADMAALASKAEVTAGGDALTQEITDRQAADDDEAKAREDGDSDEAAARLGADEAEAKARQDADTAETKAREDADTAEAKARKEADEAEEKAREEAVEDEAKARDDADKGIISSLDDYQLRTEKDQANGYAGIGPDGKINVAALPALAVTKTTVVASQAAQLALTAQEGDVAVRTDQSRTYIHNGGSAGTMADWTEFASPTDLVLSVAGKTGVVTLTYSDISGLGTAATKDAGAAGQTGKVLNADDPTTTDARTPKTHASSHKTGSSDPLSPSDIGAAAASHTHVESDVTNLVTDLAAKQDRVKRVKTAANGTSITPEADSYDVVKQTNTEAAGTLTIKKPTGTPTDGQELILRVKSTNVQTLSFEGIYRGSLDTALPTATTGGSLTDYMKFAYNSTDEKWDLIAISFGY